MPVYHAREQCEFPIPIFHPGDGKESSEFLKMFYESSLIAKKIIHWFSAAKQIYIYICKIIIPN